MASQPPWRTHQADAALGGEGDVEPRGCASSGSTSRAVGLGVAGARLPGVTRPAAALAATSSRPRPDAGSHLEAGEGLGPGSRRGPTSAHVGEDLEGAPGRRRRRPRGAAGVGSAQPAAAARHWPRPSAGSSSPAARPATSTSSRIAATAPATPRWWAGSRARASSLPGACAMAAPARSGSSRPAPGARLLGGCSGPSGLGGGGGRDLRGHGDRGGQHRGASPPASGRGRRRRTQLLERRLRPGGRRGVRPGRRRSWPSSRRRQRSSSVPGTSGSRCSRASADSVGLPGKARSPVSALEQHQAQRVDVDGGADVARRAPARGRGRRRCRPRCRCGCGARCRRSAGRCRSRRA